MQSITAIAQDFFQFVDTIDPGKKNWERFTQSAKETCADLTTRFQELRSQINTERMEESVRASLQEALTSSTANLERLSEALAQRSTLAQAQWRQFHETLSHNYTQLAVELEKLHLDESTDTTFRKVVPVNYGRNVFHVANGLAAAVTYHYLLPGWPSVALIFGVAIVFTSLEIARRHWKGLNGFLFNSLKLRTIARPHEHYKVNSAIYYTYGLLASALLFPAQAVEIACLVLAFGDPAASIFGKRYGRLKIYRDKSLVGSTAFAGAAFLFVFLYHLIAYPHQTLAHGLLLALIGGVIGATAEALSSKLDDNLTVPFVVSLALMPLTL